MVVIEVKGVKQLVKRLSGYRKNVGRGVERGLKAAGLMLLRESQNIVPVQLGNLKAAGEVRKQGSGLMTIVLVGYFGVGYAPYVHEVPGLDLSSPVTHGRLFNIKHREDIIAAKGTKWGTAEGGMFARKPEEQWKFLERPVKEHRREVLKIIRNEILKTKK